MALVKATVADIPRILPCAREYTDIIPGMEFNAYHYVEYWRRALTSEIGVIFLDVDPSGTVTGGIGGIVSPEPLSGRLTAIEMFWYTAAGRRGAGIKLYNRFKQWAREQGATRLAMIYLPCSMPDEIKRFYEREGLSLLEMHYEGELK